MIPRYEDFFGGKRQKNPKKKSKPRYESEEDEEEDEGVPNQINESLQSHEKELPRQINGSLSTHEKELEKQRSKIEQMEQENLNPKPWMLPGESESMSFAVPIQLLEYGALVIFT